VGQEQRRAVAMNLVVDVDPVTTELWHRGFPDISVAIPSLARSIGAWEMRKWRTAPTSGHVTDTRMTLPQRTKHRHSKILFSSINSKLHCL
jgi:hypothetical protein